ncbi:hypothetical protein U1Q18_051701 [Sarracenia purpurea var. burkii]
MFALYRYSTVLSKAPPQAVTKDCPVTCENVHFAPVCAHRLDRKEALTTFSSECSLKKFNCDYERNYVKIRDAPCIGAYGGRLDNWKEWRDLNEVRTTIIEEYKTTAPIQKKTVAPIKKKTMAPIKNKIKAPNKNNARIAGR